jgi:Fe-S-cluster-containing hydrogenase component 2
MMNTVEMVQDRPVVVLDWCLGCGVCIPVCPAGAITLYWRFKTPSTRLHGVAPVHQAGKESPTEQK